MTIAIPKYTNRLLGLAANGYPGPGSVASTASTIVFASASVSDVATSGLFAVIGGRPARSLSTCAAIGEPFNCWRIASARFLVNSSARVVARARTWRAVVSSGRASTGTPPNNQLKAFCTGLAPLSPPKSIKPAPKVAAIPGIIIAMMPPGTAMGASTARSPPEIPSVIARFQKLAGGDGRPTSFMMSPLNTKKAAAAMADRTPRPVAPRRMAPVTAAAVASTTFTGLYQDRSVKGTGVSAVSIKVANPTTFGF